MNSATPVSTGGWSRSARRKPAYPAISLNSPTAASAALALSEGRVTLDEGAVAEQRAADRSLDHDDPIEEVFEDQLACADLVVLSKSDLVSPAALAQIEAHLKSMLRPGVNIVRSRGDLAPLVLIGLNSAAEA